MATQRIKATAKTLSAHQLKMLKMLAQLTRWGSEGSMSPTRPTGDKLCRLGLAYHCNMDAPRALRATDAGIALIVANDENALGRG